jgi:hypothetical protein
MRKIQTEIYQILPAVNNSVENITAGIIQELEKRAIGAGTVTRDGLEGLLRLTLEQALVERGIGVPNQTADIVENVDNSEIENAVYAQENNLWIGNPSAQELNAMYQSWVMDILRFGIL